MALAQSSASLVITAFGGRNSNGPSSIGLVSFRTRTVCFGIVLGVMEGEEVGLAYYLVVGATRIGNPSAKQNGEETVQF